MRAKQTYIPLAAATQRHLMRRGGSLVYKRNVPKDLQPLFPASKPGARHKWGIWITLPKDEVAAARQARAYDKHYDGLFAKLRTRAVRDAIAANGGAKAVRDALDLFSVDLATSAALASDPDWRSELIPDSIPELLEAEAIVRRTATEAARLRPITDALWDNEAQVGPLISTACDQWLASPDVREGTRAIRSMILRRLRESVGDLPMRSITRKHILTFMDQARRLPAHAGLPKALRNATLPELVEWGKDHPDHPSVLPSVFRNYVVNTRSFFEWAKRREIVTENPVTNIDIPKDNRSREELRQPFHPSDLPRVMDSVRDRWGCNSDDYWIVMIAAYTGARLLEVAGLAHADLEQHRDAPGWFINFRDNSYRTVKTRSSERLLPVHPDFVSDLVAHVAATPSAGLLFPSMGPDPQRNADNLSARFKRVLQGIPGLDSSRLTFHSLRHSFEDHAEERLPDAAKRAMTGHAKTGASKAYGRGPGLRKMVEWTSMLDPLGLHSKPE